LREAHLWTHPLCYRFLYGITAIKSRGSVHSQIRTCFKHHSPRLLVEARGAQCYDLGPIGLLGYTSSQERHMAPVSAEIEISSPRAALPLSIELVDRRAAVRETLLSRRATTARPLTLPEGSAGWPCGIASDGKPCAPRRDVRPTAMHWLLASLFRCQGADRKAVTGGPSEAGAGFTSTRSVGRDARSSAGDSPG
jgi:hypothetical protein